MQGATITRTPVPDIAIENDMSTVRNITDSTITDLNVIRSWRDVHNSDGASHSGQVVAERAEESDEIGRSAVVDDHDVDTDRVLHCRGCDRDLPEKMFSRDGSKPSGRHSRCAQCKSGHKQKYSRLLVIKPAMPSRLMVISPTKKVMAPPQPVATEPRMALTRRPKGVTDEDMAIARRNAMMMMVNTHREEFERLCAEERGKLVRSRGGSTWVTL